ncbi:hypothetical protein [Exiguobacterium sp. s193]|uniref:hypothetical protein n=1 Tax=Exiguobacterium sp. s193 TaxID=2751207 RepID=UPI0020368B24|nr:hypothetical protein [Exiguobacterium sp. s193]
MMKRFVKNEAVGLAIAAFKELEDETFKRYNAELSLQEQQALNFVIRALELESERHLTLALETQQPIKELDRVLVKLATVKNSDRLFRLLLERGIDLNEMLELDGHRSLVRQPLVFPVGLYSAVDQTLFQLAIESNLDLTYTTSLQRSDRFLETDSINMLDLLLLLDIETDMAEASLDCFTDHKATVGLVERLKRSKRSLVGTVVARKKYQVDFQYAKHYPLFYAMVGRQTEVFEQLLADVLAHESSEVIIQDALLAFHNHQPGQANAFGEDYIESLYHMGEQLRRRANVDFNQVEDAYVLMEYQEIVERLRKDSRE